MLVAPRYDAIGTSRTSGDVRLGPQSGPKRTWSGRYLQYLQ